MPDDNGRTFLGLSQLGAYEERAISEYNDALPQSGDRLFVESQDGIRLDPLGMSDPRSGERTATGRRELYANGYREAGDRLVNTGRIRTPKFFRP